MTERMMLEAKQLGYSDIQISQRMKCKEDEVRRNFKRPPLFLSQVIFLSISKFVLFSFSGNSVEALTSFRLL